MNYYPHHIGDYLRDTAHLTATEDGIYRRLLDIYYASEKPIPLETHWVCRLLRVGENERETVEFILGKYFEKMEDGWHNKRADLEIERHHKRVKAAKRNGKTGGRPRNPLGLQKKPTGLAKTDSPQTQEKANHNHNQILNTDAFDSLWAIYPKRAGGNPKDKAAKAFRARLRDGSTAEEIIEGARRYAEFVRATGKEGTEYVKQAASFLGPERHFLEQWELPEQANVSPLYSRKGVM